MLEFSYSGCGPQPVSLGSSGSLSERQTFRPYPRPETRICIFNKSPSSFIYILKPGKTKTQKYLGSLSDHMERGCPDNRCSHLRTAVCEKISISGNPPEFEVSLLYGFLLSNSVLFSHSVMSDSLRPHVLEHTRLPCPSPSPRACSNSCPLSR